MNTLDNSPLLKFFINHLPSSHFCKGRGGGVPIIYVHDSEAYLLNIYGGNIFAFDYGFIWWRQFIIKSITCPYSESFWSIFSRIRTEYGEILCISPYSVRMQENTDQKNSEYGHFSRSDNCLILSIIDVWQVSNCVYDIRNKNCFVLVFKAFSWII